MALASILQPVSILIELLVFGIGIALAVAKKKTYGWFIALTFGIYVVYDISKAAGTLVPDDLLAVIFLVASISMLWVAWSLYRGS